jgi:Flp pilus assembly protein TadG
MSLLRRILPSFARHERGVAIIEAAVVLPFVLVLGLGTIEFGWILAQMQDVQTSLRDSVRYVTRRQILTATDGTVSLSSSATTYAYGLLDAAFTRNGIKTYTRSISLAAIANATGTYLGGSNVYRIQGTVTFKPASAGLLTIVRLSPPIITLRYEARHVGG